jgi:hypothetical protein
LAAIVGGDGQSDLQFGGGICGVLFLGSRIAFVFVGGNYNLAQLDD